MLTRGIGPDDVVLGLLDICLDDAMCIADRHTVDYANCFVKIELTRGESSIEGKCVVIIREVASNCALNMGREPDDGRDFDSATGRPAVSRHLFELICRCCEEGGAAAATASSHESKGLAEASTKGVLVAFDAAETKSKTSQSKASDLMQTPSQGIS